MNMGPHDFIKPSRQLIARVSPFADSLKPQDCRAEHCRVKVLMGNGIPPLVQFLQAVSAALISEVEIPYLGPEDESESIVIFTDVAGIRIALVQLPVLDKDIPEGRSQ